jgi:hypothetical protein
MLVGFIHEDRSSKNEPGTAHADGRFGGYVGLVYPRHAPMRFRANLTADFLPPALIERSAEGVALTPWWAAALALGVEFGGP